MVLIVLILLNMLIAIVMDAYDEVITGLDHEDSIMIMMGKAYKMKMAKWKKEELPMLDVLRGVQAKMKAEAQRKKDEDVGQDLGDEIDSDDDDDGKGKITGKFKQKKRRFSSTAHKELEPNVTVSVLKELFMRECTHPRQESLSAMQSCFIIRGTKRSATSTSS
jgi:hypothetical protein